MEKMRQWTLLAVVAVVVILAGGWFGLVSKKRGEVSALRATEAATQSDTRRIASEIKQLEEQAKHLSTQDKLRVQMSKQMPNHPALPTLIRYLTDAADKAGLTLVSLEPEKPTLLESATTTTTTTTTTTAASARSSASAASAAGSEVVAVIPLKITLNGNYPHIVSFLDELEKMPRALMLPEFTVEAEDITSSASSTAVTEGKSKLTGSLTAELSARVFMTAPRPAPVVRRSSSEDAAAEVK